MPRPQKKKEKTNQCPHCGQMFGGSGFLTHVRFCELKHRPQPTAPPQPAIPEPQEPQQTAATYDDYDTDEAKIILWNELPQNQKPASGWAKLGEALATAIEKNADVLAPIAATIIAGMMENQQAEQPQQPQLDPDDPKNDWILKANYFKE